MSKHHRRQFGQGLLEVIIAIAVIATGLAGVMSLTGYSIKAADVSSQQVMATNLAREGLEVVRHIRDSNWLAGAVFYDGLVQFDNDLNGTTKYHRIHNRWEIDFEVDDIMDEEANLLISANTGIALYGMYHHGTVPGDKKDTTYQRLLTIYPICAAAPDSFAISCPAPENIIGLRVLAEVQWLERGQTKSLVLEDRLFNWK